jgi:anti-sigma B factor antagonist
MSAGTVRFDTRGNVLIARMAGEIDLSNAERLGLEVVEATPPEAERVVIDLTEVEHIDSYGIFVINGVRQRLAEQGQALVLIVPEDAPVKRAIELMGIGDYIPIKRELDDALSTSGPSE